MANDLVKAEATGMLARLEQARQLLAVVRTVDEAKRIRDQAEAVRVYLRQQALGLELVNDAAEIKARADRRLGELVQELPKNPGTLLRGSTPEPRDPAPTLEELGIGKKLSHRCQQVASIPDADFERHVAEVRGRGEELTSQGFIDLARRRKRSRVAAAAAPLPATLPPSCRIEVAHGLDFLASLEPGSLDLVFGSPPYEMARLYLEGGRDLGIARDTREWVAFMVEVYRAALRACKGLVAFVVDGQTTDYRWSGAPHLLAAALLDAGVCLRKDLLYRRVGIPGSGGKDWLRNDYEFIICATNGGRLPWSDQTALGHEPKYRPGGDLSHRTASGARVNGYATPEDRNNLGPHRARCRAGRSYQPPEKANPGNVVQQVYTAEEVAALLGQPADLCDCAVGGGRMGSRLAHENEAPFPERLAEFMVRTFCPPGGLVCDVFAGSGTVAAVALRHGRRFAGCDLRESQVELSRQRVAEELVRQASEMPPPVAQDAPGEAAAAGGGPGAGGAAGAG
jgi:DNA modification methylase